MYFYTIDFHNVLFESSLKLSNLYYLSVTQLKGTMCVSLKGNINNYLILFRARDWHRMHLQNAEGPHHPGPVHLADSFLNL